MNTFSWYRIFGTICFLLCFNISAFSQTPDYSSYEISKKYKKDNNFILAYKHLLIFKFSNIERLNKPENAEALKKLDLQIKELEEHLMQNYAWYDIKKSRGFSDKQLDSTLKNQSKKIIFKDINIQ